MSRPKRIVLFVEGEGDLKAGPMLAKKIVTAKNLWEGVTVDPDPFRVRSLGTLLRNDGEDWIRWLKSAYMTRLPLGGVLLLLDGDTEKVGNVRFCAKEQAAQLATLAQRAGAGRGFSVAVVFALREFESWFLAILESFAGRLLPDGRQGVKDDAVPPSGDLEVQPRDAKGWLNKAMHNGYKVTTDQVLLTEMLDIELLRARQLRSFRRLESAIHLLATAIQTNHPIVSPFLPPPPPAKD